MNPHASLVIPLFNEAGNILPLLTASVEVLTKHGCSFEIILVNDCSTDTTAEEIAQAVIDWPQCRVVTMPRQSGQALALLAGLQAAQGNLLLTMDGDGQNDPRDFPALLALVESGTLDVACGRRIDRQDSWLRRNMSRFANAVRRRWLNDGVHDAGCQLRVMRQEVRNALFPLELLQSFLPAIAAAAGWRVGETPVRHHPRQHGESKYGFRKLWWKPAVTMFQLRRRLHRGGRT